MTRRNAAVLVFLVAVLGLVWWLSGTSDAPEGLQPDEGSKAQASGPRARPAAWGKADREVWTQPKATVRGVVRDTDGAPIAGASVCAFTRSEEVPSALQREPACATSGPKGAYQIENLLAVSYVVSGSAPNFRPAAYEDPDAPPTRRSSLRLQAGQTREGIDLVLAPGGVLARGVVKDLSGGPIAGAWVRVSEGRGWFGNRGFSATVTNDEGEFETWTSPGRVQVTATADGYTETNESGIAPGQTLEIFLTPASALVGKVVFAETGEAVGGARVEATMQGIFNRPRGHTHTDTDGTFRIESLEPGTYKLGATTPELYGMSTEAIHLGLAETSEPIVIEVHPAFAIEGRVVVADGKETPCPAGSVQLTETKTQYGGHARLEPDGSFVVRALQPGTYRVNVDCTGYISAEDYPDVAITEASVSGLVWEVQEGRAIRGEVVHANGDPVEGMNVSAQPQVDGSTPRAQKTNAWARETDAGGAFELRGLLPGKYQLTTISWEIPGPDKPVEVEVPEGRDLEGVRIELPATGTIVGTVRDERGQPMDGVSVNVRSDSGGWGQTISLDDGTFRIEAVKPGGARVQASGEFGMGGMRSPGKSDDDVQGERVVVVEGEEVEVELVVEAHDGTIRGRVVDAEGGPLSDAFVDVQRESDSAAASAGVARRAMSWGSWWRDPILTDTDGHFEIDELADGRYTLRAFREGGGEGVLEGVEVGSDVTIELDSPGTLEGKVTIDGGASPQRFSVSIRDERTGHNAHDTFFRTDGKWRLTDVPEGKYALEVKAPEGTGKADVELGPGEEKTGIDIELTGTVTLRGTLVDLETGAPVPGMKVTSSTRGGTIVFNMETTKDKKEISDEQGRFEVENVSVGRGRLTVSSFGFAETDYEFMTSVPIDVPKGVDVHELEPVGLIKKRTKDRQRPGSLGLQTRQPEPDEEDEDRRHIVAVVRPGGPADNAGIQVGDEIVAVDGHDVRGANAHRYTALTRAPPGQVLSLTLDDDRKVTVKLGPPE